MVFHDTIASEKKIFHISERVIFLTVMFGFLVPSDL
jgi:hypothetical protein